MQTNAEKASQTAKSLYPNEKWEELENSIFITKTRIPRSTRQFNILKNELRQARILVARGSTIYLLPENVPPLKKDKKFPDAVVDGLVMEFKTITGGIRNIDRRFKEARGKAANVFLFIDTDLTARDVRWKLSRCVSRNGFTGGTVQIYFAQSGNFYKWSEAELLSGL